MATLEQRIYNADRAREILENEAFNQAFIDIKAEITDQWKQSPARDKEGRESLWNLLKLADKLELTLRSSLDDGKLAKEELQHKQGLLDRAKSAIGLS